MSAVDAETGACYTKRIGRQGEPGELIDTPLDQITFKSTSAVQGQTGPLRATQQRYQDAMERLAGTQQADTKAHVASSIETDVWTEKVNSDADQQPKYLLYTNGKLLGHSLLERARSGGERRGRFHLSEEYFEYADIFAALPQPENDCLEANAAEAYGILAEENDGYARSFGFSFRCMLSLSVCVNHLRL